MKQNLYKEYRIQIKNAEYRIKIIVFRIQKTEYRDAPGTSWISGNITELILFFYKNNNHPQCDHREPSKYHYLNQNTKTNTIEQTFALPAYEALSG